MICDCYVLEVLHRAECINGSLVGSMWPERGQATGLARGDPQPRTAGRPAPRPGGSASFSLQSAIRTLHFHLNLATLSRGATEVGTRSWTAETRGRLARMKGQRIAPPRSSLVRPRHLPLAAALGMGLGCAARNAESSRRLRSCAKFRSATPLTGD